MAYLTVLKTRYNMEPGMKRLYLILLIFLLSFLSFFSCKKTESTSKFFSEIKAIDSYISSGDTEKARNALLALTNSAKDARSVLTIAKRMLVIGAKPELIKFLQDSIPSKVDSPEVVALLITTLIDVGRAEEAYEYTTYVKNSSYAALIAEASALKRDVKTYVSIDPYCWESAYRLTGEQSFLNMSALCLCKNGKLSQAEFLREAIPKDGFIKDPFLWATISYDLGHFDFLFKSLDLSILKAEEIGVFELKKASVDKASRHLLLVADAAYSTGDIDVARSYWQACADLPRPTPIALYNLARTSETEEERANIFVECLTKYPHYYPALSSYVRQYLALKSSETADEITKYLADRGFYSMKMEDVYLSLPNMVFSPETLLKTALQQKDCDPRIAIEYFRYKHYQGMDFRAGIADMWKLLEDYPDNSDIRTYAKWYFSQCRDFNACFSVGKTGDDALDAFYLGLEKAIRSSTDSDIIESFSKAATVPEYKVFSTANIAYVYYQMGLKDKAVETLSVASSMTEDVAIKSKLHYQVAKILVELKSYDRAISVLGYAIEIDPENYPAQVLLEKLESLK